MELDFPLYVERRRGLSDSEKSMILEIEKDMESVRKLSDDMNDIVSGQGQQVCLLEDSVESAKVRTIVAEKELVRASEYQASTRYGLFVAMVAGTFFINVPLGLAFGIKAGLIGTGCCVGVGAVKTAVDWAR